MFKFLSHHVLALQEITILLAQCLLACKRCPKFGSQFGRFFLLACFAPDRAPRWKMQYTFVDGAENTHDYSPAVLSEVKAIGAPDIAPTGGAGGRSVRFAMLYVAIRDLAEVLGSAMQTPPSCWRS